MSEEEEKFFEFYSRLRPVERDEDRADKLIEELTRRINTTMIGALSTYEKHMGNLWGIGKPVSSLNTTELAMRAVFDRVRTEVLDNGNAQKRACTIFVQKTLE